MISRIEIFSKFSDPRAEIQKRKLLEDGWKGRLRKVAVGDLYTLEKEFTPKQLEQIVPSLANPVSQKFSINKPSPSRFTWAVEIGFLPGVTDNVANTAKEIVEDKLRIKFGKDEGLYTSRIFYFTGSLSEKEIKVVAETLFNPLIQRVYIKSFNQFKQDGGMEKIIPRVKLDKGPQVDEVSLNVDDEELKAIGKSGIKNKDGTRCGPLALDLTYMKAIRDYFNKLKRNPTDVELESLAQTWSEHCKHTIFADPIDEIKEGLFKTYIKGATEKIRKVKGKKDICVSVFEDNSGAIEFDNNFLITHKVETHNSPSALDPFGGSITGIVGVNRDTIGFGKGAKPVANIYGFCFADPKIKTNLYKDQALTQKMLSPRRIMEGVIEGVNSGGNCSGIPTAQGFVYFDPRYQGKPLVFVGTVGLIPKKIKNTPSYVKKAIPGDLIVMVGGRVGQDGIHGATFSSEALSSGSPATAVQIGDPITQKKLSDAIVKEARDRDLFDSITDNGAGGLSCSVAEMARESGGCEVDLAKVPLKYSGLEPWKIWISESQERMTLAVPKSKWRKFYDLMKRRGVEATIIGKFTDSGKCLVKYQKRVVINIDMEFLHDGLPPRPMKTVALPDVKKEPDFLQPKNLNKILLEMLSRLNIAGYEFISKQFDHEVQGGSVLKPLQGRGRINSEATVFRPVLNSPRGVVLSQGLYPSYGDIDAYHMAACSIDTAIRNAVCAGADLEKLALLDNFCWCSSNDPVRLWQLKKAAQACYDYANIYQTPFISGKDSMFNDFNGFDEKGAPLKISIPPTLLISSIGIIDDIKESISLDLKFPGDLIYILGQTIEETGGTEYFALMRRIGHKVPKVDAQRNKKLYQTFCKCAKKGLIASAISVSRGGIGVVLAKSAMAGKLGIEVDLGKISKKRMRNDYLLFSETQGRIVFTVNPANKAKLEETMGEVEYFLVGKVKDNNLITILNRGQKMIEVGLVSCLTAYRLSLKNY